MPVRNNYNLREKPTREQRAEANVIESHERKAKDRERFLDHLAKRHAERLGLSATVARSCVEAVAVSAKKREPDPYNGL
jgi:hypothetical protein